MNRKTVSSALVAVAAFAGAAYAQGPIEQAAPFHSARTQAEVQAELVQYKKAGVNHASTWYNPLRSFQGKASRDAVTAEYIASRNEVAALTAEDSGSAYLQRVGAQRNLRSDTLAGQPQRAQ
jgi:hypothetical protein